MEWLLFILVLLVRGELQGAFSLRVAGMPLVVFYLAACGLAATAQKSPRITTGRNLLGLALGLVSLDRFSKTLVLAFIPYDTPVPVVKDWLHLTHVYNLHGSWLIATFTIHFVGTGLLMVLTGLIAVGTVFGYRYYTCRYRQSVWTDVAFLGLFAGYLSWMIDMGLRGAIVDFINLPGVVTADIKDILLALGAAAFFAGGWDNPRVSFRWKGWRQESEDLHQFAVSVVNFARAEIRGIKNLLLKLLRSDAPGSR